MSGRRNAFNSQCKNLTSAKAPVWITKVSIIKRLPCPPKYQFPLPITLLLEMVTAGIHMRTADYTGIAGACASLALLLTQTIFCMKDSFILFSLFVSFFGAWKWGVLIAPPCGHEPYQIYTPSRTSASLSRFCLFEIFVSPLLLFSLFF